MGNKKSVKERIPLDIFERVENIKKEGNFKHRIDAFSFMNHIQPIILDEKSVRLPRSKVIMKQIDVRYFFKDKHEKTNQK